MYGQAFMLHFGQGHVLREREFHNTWSLDAAVPRLYVEIIDTATSVGKDKGEL